MFEDRDPNDRLTEDQKRELFDTEMKRNFSQLGIRPELFDAKISFGPRSTKTSAEQFELALALGAQLASGRLREDFMDQVHTIKDFQDFLSEFSQPPKRSLSAIAREVLRKIARFLPRNGGPGRDPILTSDERNLAMKLMRDSISNGFALSWKDAAQLLAEHSELSLKKKIAFRTLEKLASDENKKLKRQRAFGNITSTSIARV